MSTTSENHREGNRRKVWTSDELLSQITQITNGRKTGKKIRHHYSQMLKALDPMSLSKVLDQAHISQAEELEGHIISKIQTIRMYSSQPRLKISKHLGQVGKAQSQYFCGNCLRTHNEVPYPTLSFSMKMNDRDSLKTCSEKLAAYWKITEIKDVLEDDSLTEIGVGVWGTSHTMVVTIVTTPESIQLWIDSGVVTIVTS